MNIEFAFEYILRKISSRSSYTVVPTKSDSDDVFCLQSYRTYDRYITCVLILSYLQDRINIHRVPTSFGNHGKHGKSQKVPCMENSWNLKKT